LTANMFSLNTIFATCVQVLIVLVIIRINLNRRSETESGNVREQE
jgi:hypothetical protein